MIIEKSRVMKAACKILVIVFLACWAAVDLNAQIIPKEEVPPVIENLWRAYRKERRESKQLSILEQIRQYAVSMGLKEQIYESSRTIFSIKYYHLNSGQTDSVYKETLAFIEENASPFFSLYFVSNSYWRIKGNKIDYLLKNKDALSGCYHKQFLMDKERGGYRRWLFRNFPIELIDNDFDYFLWAWGGEKDIKDNVKGNFLQEGYLKCLEAKEEKDLEALLQEYSGTSLEFIPKGKLLCLRFQEMEKNNASEQDFKELDSQVNQYLKEVEQKAKKDDVVKYLAASFEDVRKLSANLNDEAIVAQREDDGTYTLYCRNVSGPVSVKVRNTDQDKVVYSGTVDKSDNHFYLYDTLCWKIPKLEDGHYEISFNKGKGISRYNQYGLSVAVIDNSQVFAADSKTGEPVDNLNLLKIKSYFNDRKDKLMFTRKLDSSGEFFDLPQRTDFSQDRNKNSYDLWYMTSAGADGTQKRSSYIHTGSKSRGSKESDEGSQVMFIPDKGAYRPGDTLRFKIVAFDGDPYKAYRVLEGEKIIAVLSDADLAEVERMSLTTNGLGSASGSFFLPEGYRNGNWKLDFIMKDRNVTCNSFVRVDEYSLPSFEMTFDNPERLYQLGDTVTVSGTLTTFSGHPLTDADIDLAVINYRDTLSRQKVELLPGGRFSAQYVPEENLILKFHFKVSDKSGEVREFEQKIPVSLYFDLDVELENSSKAQFHMPKPFDSVKEKFLKYDLKTDCPRGVISSDTAAFVVTASEDYSSGKIKIPYTYTLLSLAGDTLHFGGGETGTRQTIDLSSFPEQIFLLKVKGKVRKTLPESSSDLYLEDSLTFFLLKDSGSETIPQLVESYFDPLNADIVEGDNIKFKLGAASGEIWVAAALFDEDKLLHKQIIHLDGNKTSSLNEFVIPYKPEYSEAVRLCLLYFRHNREVEYEQVYTRKKKDIRFRIEATHFPGQLSPSKEYEYKFTLSDKISGEAVASVFDRSADIFQRNMWKSLSLLTKTPSKHVDTYVGMGGDGEHQLGWGEDDLEEIVVIAYGVGKKRSGANDFAGALRGRVAGITVNSTDHLPGTMRIRGVAGSYDSSEPLYIVDGVPVPGDAFASLSPSDIQSVNILKDASSSAIYGSGAANGVVVITTNKSGMAAQGASYLPDFSEISMRKDFKDVLSFQPHLTVKNGEVSFRFKTSDRLSSYHLYLFAHNKDMRNGFFSKDLTVSIPVKVSLTEPRYLYAGDRYDISATVAAQTSDTSETFDGRAYIVAYNGTPKTDEQAPLQSYSEHLSLEAGTSMSVHSPIDIAPGMDTLGLRVAFQGEDFSDAVQLAVPVKEASQSITEAHSAVLLSGADDQEAIRRLRYSFNNVSSEGAEIKQETVSDILQRFVKAGMESRGEDVISKLDALCFAKMPRASEADSTSLNTDADTLWNEVMAFRDSTGGFSWMKEMKANQTITAAVLERFAYLRSIGCDIPDMSPTVRYLDSNQFAVAWPWWCGGLSEEQYMYVRSFYPEIVFNDGFGKDDRSERKTFRSNLSAFRKFARSYLSPSYKKDFPNYWTFEKARRIRTVQNLLSSDKGMALGKAWGENLFATAKFNKSVEDDVLNLIDYAQHHPDGGSYYPNAVMPFKGMLENEAFAHSLISDVLSAYSSQDKKRKEAVCAAEIADQVRLWLLLQAQTQKWSNNLYFLNAVRSINDASDSIRQTSVLTLSKTEKLPFADIKSSGNGFTIERIFLRDGVELKDGDAIHRGEKICAEYRIWSKENRSFVKVTAPREACLMPVEQLSGKYYGLKPLVLDNWYRFTPSAYRCVRKDRTEYYFDVLAEESCTIREEFYVVQNGRFSAPVVEVESSYVPAYRANGKFTGSLSVETE